MKRMLVAGLVTLLMYPFAAYAVIPGETTAVAVAVKAQTALQKVHFRFMEMQMVKDAKVLWDNYAQTKRYYDMIEEASKNRGGLLGYYRDRFLDRLDEGVREEYWRLQQLREGSEENALKRLVDRGEAWTESKVDETADRWIENMDAELKKMTEIVDKAIYKSKMRDEQLENIMRDAGRNGITDNQYDSLHLQALLLIAEYLAAIDKQNQQIFTEEVRRLQRELRLQKRNSATSKELAGFMTNRMKAQHRRAGLRGEMTESQLLSVLREVPEP